MHALIGRTGSPRSAAAMPPPGTKPKTNHVAEAIPSISGACRQAPMMLDPSAPTAKLGDPKYECRSRDHRPSGPFVVSNRACCRPHARALPPLRAVASAGARASCRDWISALKQKHVASIACSRKSVRARRSRSGLAIRVRTWAVSKAPCCSKTSYFQY